MADTGRLYVVATPIGNNKDITLRALDVLRSVDAIVCEEYKTAGALLRSLGIDKPLFALNEHNERTDAETVAAQLRMGKSLALISEAGTPVFADPGRTLLALLAASGIPVAPVPGPSSLTAALSVCDFDMRRFLFAGFLDRDVARRLAELEGLRRGGTPLVLLEAPYRLAALLRDIVSVFGADWRVMLACDLTLPAEKIYRGTAADVLAAAGEEKREFVLIGAGSRDAPGAAERAERTAGRGKGSGGGAARRRARPHP